MYSGVPSSRRFASVASRMVCTISDRPTPVGPGSLIAEALRSIPSAVSRAFEMVYVTPYQAARRPDRFAETARRGNDPEF